MRRSISVLLATLVLTCSVLAQQRETPRALAEMVAAERAFARYCTEHGVRESWLEFFADDGVIFHPGPVNAKEFYRPRPPTPQPLPFTLNWTPTYGDISQAGDLGYNIGPWTAVDNVPPLEPSEHGYFFSVWRRQPDGSWKVAVDFGTGALPGAADARALGQPFTPARQYKAKVPRGADADAELRRLTELDRGFAEEAKRAGALDAYLARVADDAKVFAAGAPPAGKDALRARISAGQDVSLTLAPLAGGMAKSGDLAYTYGGYELRAGGVAKERGYYAHLWKRDERGRWQIVVTNFHPEKAP
jgi:ketosteroid isomerase-like protein